MEDQMDYIEQLMIAKLSGNINLKDSEFLDEMIKADTSVAKLWQEHQMIVNQLKSDYNKDKAWQNIQTGIKQRQSKKKLQIQIFILIAIVGVITLTLLLRNPVNDLRENLTTAAVNHTNINTIRFTTGSQTVSIDRNFKKDTATDAANISIQNDILVFTPKENTSINTIGTLEVPQGLDKKILLSDGTIVWVNAATKISFPLVFFGNSREVTLDGEAYFEVYKNKVKPFIVHTREMDVQILGTHFNIKAYPNEPAQASLVEGSILASHKSQKILLMPGNAAILKGNTFTKKEFEETAVLGWMKGVYYFNNESLAVISHTVERWFGYSFTYEDLTITNIEFSGALWKAQNLKDFLDRLCSSANLKYTITEKQIKLQRE